MVEILAQVQKPEQEEEEVMVQVLALSESLRTKTDAQSRCPNSNRQQFTLPLPFCSLLILGGLPELVRVIFTQFSDSNVNLSRNTS